MSRLEHKVWKAANKVLSDKEWEAFRYRFVDELSYEDIGLALGITRQGARHRVRTALHKVRDELNREEAA